MEVGTDVWVRDDANAWIRASIVSKPEENDEKKIAVTVRLSDGEERVVLQPHDAVPSDLPDIKPCNQLVDDEAGTSGVEVAKGVSDLIHLTHLHEPAILHMLCLRFEHNIIYTYTGPILIAVNPFQRLPIYSQIQLEQYYTVGLLQSQGVDDVPNLPPHVFAVADRAYRAMMADDDDATPHPSPAAGAGGSSSAAALPSSHNQSLLVSGESGAGKTETVKFVMRYLATVGGTNAEGPGAGSASLGMPMPGIGAGAGAGAGMGAEVGTGPTDASVEAGAGADVAIEQQVLMSNPILEAFGNAKTLRNENSSRFGKFIELQFGWRGQLIGAAIQTYLLEKVRLVYQAVGERNYHVFYQLIAGADDATKKRLKLTTPEDYYYLAESKCYTLSLVTDEEEFVATRRAMTVMRFSDAEQDGIFQCVSAVLQLGNISFEGEDKSNVSEDSWPALENAAELLGVSADDLQTVLVSHRLVVRGTTMHVDHNPEQASNSRDALTKYVYGKMFDWIVRRVNTCIQHDAADVASFIGVLDIFGFEVFETNSFEQLCINFANETLQQQFNQFVFKLEQELYKREQIPWDDIEFPDNQECLDLIEGRVPPGLLALLDEACLMPRGSDEAYARKLYTSQKDHPRFMASSRNKANNEFVVLHYAGEVVYDSAGLLEKNKDSIHVEATETVKSSSQAVIASFFVEQKKEEESAKTSKPGVRRGNKVQSATVGAQFRMQLKSLLGIIRSTNPHYVRCLKPNGACKPSLMERTSLVSQLRCGGVLEAVRVSRLGYPVRLRHLEFMRRYRCLLPTAPKTATPNRAYCEDVMKHLALESADYQVGLTRVFFKKGAYVALETKRSALHRSAATSIQKIVRGRQMSAKYQRMKAAALSLQCFARRSQAIAKAHFLRQTKAATRIQAVVRMCFTCYRFLRFRYSVVSLQSAYRGAKDRVLAKELRRQRAAVGIQSAVRGVWERRRFLAARHAMIKIQCMIRCRRARDKLRKLKREAREVGNLKQDNIQLRERVKLQDQRIAELEREVSLLRTQSAERSAPSETVGSSAGHGIVISAASASEATLSSSEPDSGVASVSKALVEKLSVEVQSLQQQVEGWKSQCLQLQARLQADASSASRGSTSPRVTPGAAVVTLVPPSREQNAVTVAPTSPVVVASMETSMHRPAQPAPAANGPTVRLAPPSTDSASTALLREQTTSARIQELSEKLASMEEKHGSLRAQLKSVSTEKRQLEKRLSDQAEDHKASLEKLQHHLTELERESEQARAQASFRHASAPGSPSVKLVPPSSSEHQRRSRSQFQRRSSFASENAFEKASQSSTPRDELPPTPPPRRASITPTMQDADHSGSPSGAGSGAGQQRSSYRGAGAPAEGSTSGSISQEGSDAPRAGGSSVTLAPAPPPYLDFYSGRLRRVAPPARPFASKSSAASAPKKPGFFSRFFGKSKAAEQSQQPGSPPPPPRPSSSWLHDQSGSRAPFASPAHSSPSDGSAPSRDPPQGSPDSLASHVDPATLQATAAQIEMFKQTILKLSTDLENAVNAKDSLAEKLAERSTVDKKHEELVRTLRKQLLERTQRMQEFENFAQMASQTQRTLSHRLHSAEMTNRELRRSKRAAEEQIEELSKINVDLTNEVARLSSGLDYSSPHPPRRPPDESDRTPSVAPPSADKAAQLWSPDSALSPASAASVYTAATAETATTDDAPPVDRGDGTSDED